MDFFSLHFVPSVMVTVERCQEVKAGEEEHRHATKNHGWMQTRDTAVEVHLLELLGCQNFKLFKFLKAVSQSLLDCEPEAPENADEVKRDKKDIY